MLAINPIIAALMLAFSPPHQGTPPPGAPTPLPTCEIATPYPTPTIIGLPTASSSCATNDAPELDPGSIGTCTIANECVNFTTWEVKQYTLAGLLYQDAWGCYCMAGVPSKDPCGECSIAGPGIESRTATCPISITATPTLTYTVTPTVTPTLTPTVTPTPGPLTVCVSSPIWDWTGYSGDWNSETNIEIVATSEYTIVGFIAEGGGTGDEQSIGTGGYTGDYEGLSGEPAYAGIGSWWWSGDSAQALTECRIYNSALNEMFGGNQLVDEACHFLLPWTESGDLYAQALELPKIPARSYWGIKWGCRVAGGGYCYVGSLRYVYYCGGTTPPTPTPTPTPTATPTLTVTVTATPVFTYTPTVCLPPQGIDWRVGECYTLLPHTDAITITVPVFGTVIIPEIPGAGVCVLWMTWTYEIFGLRGWDVIGMVCVLIIVTIAYRSFRG